MKISKLFVLSTLALMIVSTPLLAETKIATVDVNRILNESREAKAKREELDILKNSAQKKVAARRQTLQDLESKLKANNVSTDSKEAESFRTQARDYSRFVKDTEEDIQQQFLKINKALTERSLGEIRKFAESSNIDLVLDKSARDRSPVLYGSGGYDITDAIIKRING